ncbi:hypothetical protein [Nonomuraea sp. NPDC023979]|uniref:hypothetical protein n=1 Tax=Nonomuraea sp. NPDC023979 TaxID=3154796 RepID=UPI0033CC5B39
MRKPNVATGGLTPIQAGQILPADPDAKPTVLETETEEQDRNTGPVTVQNIRSGNAYVGLQADTIQGEIRIP